MALEVREPRFDIIAGIQHGRDTGQQPFVSSELRIVLRQSAWVHRGVGVAEKHGVVSGLADFERNVREPCIQRGAVIHGTVVHEVHPRVQRGAGGSTRNGLGPVVAEKHTLGGQTIKIWCLY